MPALNQIGEWLSSLLGDSSQKPNFPGDTLAVLLPWEAYDETHKIFLSKNSLGFTIEAIPLVGTVDAIQKELENILQETLEEGESLQCLLWADPRVQPFLHKWEIARKEAHEVFRHMAQKRGEYYLNASHFSTRIFRFIFSYSSKRDLSQIDPIKAKREKILKLLQSFTYAFSWDIEHFLDTTSALINGPMEKGIEKRHWNPYQSLASQLPSGGRMLKVEENGLLWEGSSRTGLTTFRAVDFPQVWALPEMQHLIGDLFRDAFRIQPPFFLHYGIHCPKQSKEELRFKNRTHFIEKQGRSTVLLRMIPQLRDELQEVDLIRKELSLGSKLLWSQLSVGIWADPTQMAQAEQILKALFRVHQFTLRENRYLHLPCYLSCLPMTWGEYVEDLHELNLLRSSLPQECATLIPIQGEWMGTSTPGMLLLGRRGQLLNWNPFDNPTGNYNIVVVGRSGSGKSVFMQDLLLNGLATKGKVFVLEVGRSFEKLCDLLNGQHINFTKESVLCLNPFTFLPQEQEELETAFSFLKALIATMAAPTEGTKDVENGYIEKAIRYAWELKQNKATITDIAHWLQQQNDPRASTLGITLTPYTQEGIYARYFEGESNIDFNNPFVLIELEELKEKKDLQAVVLQLFIMAITNQAFLGDRTTRFYICIDEAWDLLRAKQSGIFIETLARRLRKYNGSLVIGTQSIDDFYAAPGALAAFENSDWMCLLAQKSSSIHRLSESGRMILNNSKKIALESVHTLHGEYSEVYIADADGNYAIAQLRLDPFSQLLYTTKAQEYTKLKELQKQGMTLAEAINHLMEKK